MACEVSYVHYRQKLWICFSISVIFCIFVVHEGCFLVWNTFLRADITFWGAYSQLTARLIVWCLPYLHKPIFYSPHNKCTMKHYDNCYTISKKIIYQNKLSVSLNSEKYTKSKRMIAAHRPLNCYQFVGYSCGLQEFMKGNCYLSFVYLFWDVQTYRMR